MPVDQPAAARAGRRRRGAPTGRAARSRSQPECSARDRRNAGWSGTTSRLLPSVRHPRVRRGFPRTRLWPGSAREPVSPRTVFRPYPALSPSPAPAVFSFAGWLARLPDADPRPRRGAARRRRDRQLRAGRGRAGHAARSRTRWSARSGRGRWTGAARAPCCPWSFTGYLLSGRRVRRRRRPRRARPGRGSSLAGADRRPAGPNIGALVRARWAHALEARRRQTAFAFESVVDEVVFVVGPPLVTFLATLVNPAGRLPHRLRRSARRRHVARPACGRRSRRCTRADDRRRRAGGRRCATRPCCVVGGRLPGGRRGLRRHGRRRRRLRRGRGCARARRAWRWPCTPAGSLVAGLVYGVVRLPGTLAARYVGLRGVLRRRGAAAARRRTRSPASSPVGVRRRAGHRAGAGLGHVAGRVAGAALGAHRGADLGGHRPDARASRPGPPLAGAAVDAWGARDRVRRPRAGGRAGRRCWPWPGRPLLRRPGAAPVPRRCRRRRSPLRRCRPALRGSAVTVAADARPGPFPATRRRGRLTR